jgi:hypothetical protein
VFALKQIRQAKTTGALSGTDSLAFHGDISLPDNPGRSAAGRAPVTEHGFLDTISNAIRSACVRTDSAI